MHGQGTYTFANGDVFRWTPAVSCASHPFALGVCASVCSAGPCIAAFLHGDERHQPDRLMALELASGELLLNLLIVNGRGTYEKGQMAKGMFLFANGDVYEGEYKYVQFPTNLPRVHAYTAVIPFDAGVHESTCRLMLPFPIHTSVPCLPSCWCQQSSRLFVTG